jgi:spermidine/putrescine transport system ATP-binding protein
MTNAFAVELTNVTKSFGQVLAVNNIVLDIKNGEFFSLLGPSGCGKTTTLRMIGGFEIPTKGQIKICGEIQGYKPPYQRPVNTVFQNYALFPHMNVYQNVAFGLQMQKVPKADIKVQVEETLELVQLPGMGIRKPNQLSGGQQQRVALARALINRPKVLLLDEPLGALDLKLRKAMQLELKNIQQKVGITFVYVTHDQEEALTMSDRIAVMNKGKVLQIDAPEMIYEHPANQFVADFIGETNFMQGKVLETNKDQVNLLLEDQFKVCAQKVGAINTGDHIYLAVRPEKLSLSNEKPQNESVSGVITEVIYIGTDLRYEVRISDNTAVVVREQNRGGENAQRYQRGNQVYVSWAKENASLLTE